VPQKGAGKYCFTIESNNNAYQLLDTNEITQSICFMPCMPYFSFF